ncbi:DUF4870 domain-containing protein [Nostoc piscinale]|uniref:DUF4870 domain-containing protein n=1 Tax=Nostoc piscinale TaxID=224012 RepID=UPI0039A52E2E
MYDPDKRKIFSALCHAAILFSTLFMSVGIPIAMLFIANDPVVLENAKESINFHLNVWIYGIIITALLWLTFGLLFPLVFLGYALHWGLTIWAIASVLTKPDKPFRYPFIFRVL